MKASLTKVGWVCMLLAAMGCGAKGPKLVSVKGKVTVGKSAPFKKGEVRFWPSAIGATYQGGVGVTDENGEFVVQHATAGRNGLEPGKYNVSFTLIQMPDGSPVPDQAGEANPKPAAALGGVEFVPAEYRGPNCDKYPTTVSESGGTFEFDIPELKPQSAGKKK